jgi:hypothetical protein
MYPEAAIDELLERLAQTAKAAEAMRLHMVAFLLNLAMLEVIDRAVEIAVDEPQSAFTPAFAGKQEAAIPLRSRQGQ